MKRRGRKSTYKALREENAKLRAIVALNGWGSPPLPTSKTEVKVTYRLFTDIFGDNTLEGREEAWHINT